MSRTEKEKAIFDKFRDLATETEMKGMQEELSTLSDEEVSSFHRLVQEGYLPLDGESICSSSNHGAPSASMAFFSKKEVDGFAVLVSAQILYLSLHDLVHFTLLMRSEAVEATIFEGAFRQMMQKNEAQA